MKRRLHLYLAGGILLIALIFGSFFDLQINQALFSKNNFFGLTVSSFGMIPGYGCLAFLGGVLFSITYKDERFKIWAKIIFDVMVLALIGLPIYFLGRDVFNVNGFNNEKLYWLGFVIMAVIVIPLGIWGFFVGKKNEEPMMWLIIIILAIAIFMALVPGTSLFKAIMHRPRYRVAVYEGYVSFHNWWEPCKDYKDIINGFPGILTKEEFKSFPSGHSTAAMIGTIFFSFLPVINKRLMKHQVLFFWLAFGWALVVMFSRILVGAHYLSDTAVGALLTIIFFYIANEIIVRKLLKKEEVTSDNAPQM